MAELIHVSKLPESILTVRAADTYGEVVFTPDEVKKAVQTGAFNLRNNINVKPAGKVSYLFFLKVLSFNKSKCGKPDNSL